MDAVSGLGSSKKVLDAIRSTPGWLLLALLISVALVLPTPSYKDLPEGMRQWLPLTIVFLAVAIICRFGSQVLSSIIEWRSRRLERDRQRFEQIYRPLAVMFVTRHVTVSTSTGAPFLRQRLAHALEEINAYRRWSVGLRQAWRVLHDRKQSTSAEVEHGGDFPSSEIVKLVNQNASLVDPTLLQLVRCADRSRYEDQDPVRLTDDEFALFEYMHGEHDRLCRRFR